MDKKSDKQFYWEVKDFMSKPKQPSVPKKVPGVVDSVKSIIEQNKPYSQNSFINNNNTINTVRQAISNIEKNKRNGTPECKAFTKNLVDHPFRSINENTTTLVPYKFTTPTITPVPKVPPQLPGTVGGSLVKRVTPQLSRMFGRTPWGRIALGLLGLGTIGAGIGIGMMDNEGDIKKGETSPKPDWVKDGDQTQTPQPVSDKPSLDDMISNLRKANQTPVPIYRPARRDLGAGVNVPSNYPEWKKATEEKNKALRIANEPLRKEQENVRGQLGSLVDQLQALRKANPSDPKIAELEAQKSNLMKKGREIYSERNPREGSLERGLDTLRGIRQARWDEKTSAFSKETGVQFDARNPQHQNIMRAQQFPSLYGGKDVAGAAIQGAKTVMDVQGTSGTQVQQKSKESLAGVPTVELSADTPDWVSRWAQKWGDDPRKIEAMRRGVVSVLGGDATKPMDTNLTPAAVGIKGLKGPR